MVFDAAHDLERWDIRFRHDDVTIEHRIFAPPEALAEEAEDKDVAPPAPREAGERFILLAIRRGDAVFPMSSHHTPREGDVATIAIHEPDRAEAEEILAERGWEAVPG